MGGGGGGGLAAVLSVTCRGLQRVNVGLDVMEEGRLDVLAWGQIRGHRTAGGHGRSGVSWERRAGVSWHRTSGL